MRGALEQLRLCDAARVDVWLERREKESQAVFRQFRRLLGMGGTGTSAEPVTLTGQFLRATVMRWEDERLRLAAEVRRTGSAGAAQVTTAAFEVAVRRLFRSGIDPLEVSWFVAELRRAFGEEVAVKETETLILAVLGEEVPIDDIEIPVLAKAEVITIGGVKDVLMLDKAGVDAILVEAEALAIERGAQPTLADQ